MYFPSWEIDLFALSAYLLRQVSIVVYQRTARKEGSK